MAINMVKKPSKQGVSTPQKKLPEAMEKFKWQPGVSPNPNGRPKGSRNKLGEDFIAAVAADFDQHGPATIKQVREERPHEYLKVVAGILPKELNVRTNALEELSEDELTAGINALRSLLAASQNGSGGDQETKH
jgi:hypothetical protein